MRRCPDNLVPGSLLLLIVVLPDRPLPCALLLLGPCFLPGGAVVFFLDCAENTAAENTAAHKYRGKR